MEEEISLSKLEFVNVLIDHPNIIKGVKQYQENKYQYFISEVCGTKWKYKIPWNLESAKEEKKIIGLQFNRLYKKYQNNLKVPKSKGIPLNQGFSSEKWICHENYPNLFPEKIITAQRERYFFLKIRMTQFKNESK